tara:strand:- start:4666 stop:5109 length:444 start_codon:yes stop_codon:yes gene_type:complete
MDVFFSQIAAYYTQVPKWPFVLMALAIICAGLFEVYNRKRHASAVDRFRSSIHSILSGVYPDPIKWPDNIDVYLGERLPAMQDVVEGFRHYIPQKDIPNYNKDWHSYCDFCEELTDNNSNIEGKASDELSRREIFQTLVSNILRHGK